MIIEMKKEAKLKLLKKIAEKRPYKLPFDKIITITVEKFIEYIDNIKSDCMIFPELFNKNGDHYKNFGNCFNRKKDSGFTIQDFSL